MTRGCGPASLGIDAWVTLGVGRGRIIPERLSEELTVSCGIYSLNGSFLAAYDDRSSHQFSRLVFLQCHQL